MVKSFLVAAIAGALGAGPLTWYAPVVDLHRERSIISMLPNGGSVEVFHSNLPRHRIIVGWPNPDASIPVTLGIHEVVAK